MSYSLDPVFLDTGVQDADDVARRGENRLIHGVVRRAEDHGLAEKGLAFPDNTVNGTLLAQGRADGTVSVRFDDVRGLAPEVLAVRFPSEDGGRLARHLADPVDQVMGLESGQFRHDDLADHSGSIERNVDVGILAGELHGRDPQAGILTVDGLAIDGVFNRAHRRIRQSPGHKDQQHDSDEAGFCSQARPTQYQRIHGALH